MQIKVAAETLDYIQTVIKTAQIVGIDNVIIEPGRIRGMDEARTVVLLQDENVPEMEFDSIGLNRTSVLLSRIALVKNQNRFAVEATIDDDKEFVRALLIKAKGTNIDYRCANPATIQAPRVINDEIVADVSLTTEAVEMLHRGVVAMGNVEIVTITSDKRGISFALEDTNCDVFDHTFGEVTDHPFTHKYPVKTILALCKKEGEGTFGIGKKGMLRHDVNGLGVYILPKV